MANFKKYRGLLGLILVVAAGLLIISWETFGRETLLYKDIIVLNEDIQKDTVITKGVLSIVKIEESSVINNPVTDMSVIIGKASKHFIPKGSQLSERFFEEPDLVLSENEYIFSVPTNWFIAIPSSIRRKDIATFYEVGSDQLGNKDFTNVDGLSVEDLNIQNSPFVECPVAFVKDGNNREVVSVGENERYDGSSKVSTIEIVVTLDTVKKMEASIQKGNKFIILYKEN